MDRKILILACVFGGLGIVLGAFGAHALKELISVEAQKSFETGVRYQMYHALFLLFVGIVPNMQEKQKKVLMYLVVSGLILFSGSIYFLSTNALTSFDFKVVGFITPIGGVLLIAAWLVLLFQFIKLKSHKTD